MQDDQLSLMQEDLETYKQKLQAGKANIQFSEIDDASEQLKTSKRKTKKICKLCVRCLTVTGSLVVNGVDFSDLSSLVGAIGETGPAGAQGLAGLIGAIGAVGPAGIQGIAGVLGAIGAAGPTGAQGIAGVLGTIGAVGPTGAQGIAGVVGAIGAAGVGTGLIPFSTGVILSGATVVSAAPILMGLGSSTVETINGVGESTMPPEAGGFVFTIPFAGTVQNLQISADLLVASLVSINTLGLQYDFTVFRAPSAPNDGIDHVSSPYLTTPLTSSLRFGFPNNVITAGTFRTATNINIGKLAVAAGDRIGIRIRTLEATDPSAADITQLLFSASLSYTPA